MRFFGKPQPKYLPICEQLKTEKNVTISCVIPAYNEAKRIGAVLDIVKECSLIDEVIVVDDCSKDNTSEVASTHLSSLHSFRVIRHPKNRGKTDAIITGVSATKGNLIIMLDADLRGLSTENIEKMIYFVINGEYSMTILDRAGDRATPTTWLSRLFGGERALWKEDFLKMKFPDRAGYKLEAIMNEFYIRHHLKVRTIYCPNLFITSQFNKHNIFKALWVYIKMFLVMIFETKFFGFYVQTQNIEEDRLVSLYRLKQRNFLKFIASFAIFVIGILLSVLTFLFLNSKTVVRKSSNLIIRR